MKRLELFYPVKPFSISQRFGESKACSQISALPIEKRIIVSKVGNICPQGFEELYPLLGMKGHTGLDCLAPDGVPIYAAHDGKVIAISTEKERGLGIDIVTDDEYDLGSFGIHHAKTRYWHLKALLVQRGELVSIGQKIGLADSTGFSSGSHLHFELKPCDLGDDNFFYNTYQKNGYYGSIDPEPFLVNIYAVDVMSLIENAKTLIKKVEEFIKNFLKK